MSFLRMGCTLLLAAGFAVEALAQYPGRITKTDKGAPVLRSVAVLEWTGDAGKPSASRLVPVTVYDGEQLNDGTIYLNRPEPLALASGVEYELQTAGKPTGIFDVFASDEVNGTWEGFGVWKPLSAVQAAKAAAAFNTSTLYGDQSARDDDKPVLKRKHPKEDDSDSGGTASSSAPESKPASGSSEPSDPDRPTLKRKAGADSGASGSAASGSSSSSSDSKAGVDPDRPTLHRSHHAADAEMQTSNIAPDPDRPRLKRGKPEGLENNEIPKLHGFPPAMQQAVAISDASSHAEHPWKYSWANLDDEGKMKSALEAMARTALGLDAPPAPAKPVRKTAAAGARKKIPLEPLPPAELADEKFRVFELAYGSNATMVLMASTPLPPAPADAGSADKAADSDEPGPPTIKRGKPTSNTTSAGVSSAKAASATKAASVSPVKAAPQKFVTLVAQPDLYGGVIVLYKSVTDAAHLDEKPRMILVDAVDAMADNRGELLFELRGKTQRQFALFRVLRGSAEQMFATVAMP